MLDLPNVKHILCESMKVNLNHFLNVSLTLYPIGCMIPSSKSAIGAVTYASSLKRRESPFLILECSESVYNTMLGS